MTSRTCELVQDPQAIQEGVRDPQEEEGEAVLPPPALPERAKENLGMEAEGPAPVVRLAARSHEDAKDPK